MKKVICILLIALMSAAALTACGKNNDTAKDNNATQNTNTGKLNDVYQAVKNAFGDEYLPNMAIDEDTLTNKYGINMDDIAEYKAEVPMISTNVDTFIGIEAKEGRADNVEQALNSYRDKLINETVQYPVNQYKVNASRVVRSGNYVFFVMLGAIDDNLVESEDENALKKDAEDKSQKAVDAINSALAK